MPVQEEIQAILQELTSVSVQTDDQDEACGILRRRFSLADNVQIESREFADNAYFGFRPSHFEERAQSMMRAVQSILIAQGKADIIVKAIFLKNVYDYSVSQFDDPMQRLREGCQFPLTKDFAKFIEGEHEKRTRLLRIFYHDLIGLLAENGIVDAGKLIQQIEIDQIALFGRPDYIHRFRVQNATFVAANRSSIGRLTSAQLAIEPKIPHRDGRYFISKQRRSGEGIPNLAQDVFGMVGVNGRFQVLFAGYRGTSLMAYKDEKPLPEPSIRMVEQLCHNIIAQRLDLQNGDTLHLAVHSLMSMSVLEGARGKTRWVGGFDERIQTRQMKAAIDEWNGRAIVVDGRNVVLDVSLMPYGSNGMRNNTHLQGEAELKAEGFAIYIRRFKSWLQNRDAVPDDIKALLQITDKDSWKFHRSNLEKDLSQWRNILIDDYHTVRLFVDTLGLFFDGTYTRDKYNFELHMRMQLVEFRTGVVVYTCCKSGRDRTSALTEIRNAASMWKARYGFFPTLEETQTKEFQQLRFLAHQRGCSRQAAGANIPGTHGLKLNPEHRDASGELGFSMLEKPMAKLAEEIWKSAKEFNQDETDVRRQSHEQIRTEVERQMAESVGCVLRRDVIGPGLVAEMGKCIEGEDFDRSVLFPAALQRTLGLFVDDLRVLTDCLGGLMSKTTNTDCHFALSLVAACAKLARGDRNEAVQKQLRDAGVKYAEACELNLRLMLQEKRFDNLPWRTHYAGLYDGVLSGLVEECTKGIPPPLKGRGLG